VEEPKIYEENAAEEALKYLKEKNNIVKGVKKLKRSKSEMPAKSEIIVSPLNKFTRTLTKPFVKGKKLVRSLTFNSKTGTDYKRERKEFRKLPSNKEDERNTSLYNSYFDKFSVESWKKLTGI